MEERLHKILARSGYGSRRQCEKFILDGRVRVDQEVIRKLGTKVDPDQAKIYFEGRLIRSEPKVYYLINKPKGYLCTSSDPDGRRRVIDLFKEKTARLYTVGRLDIESSGLLIVTNDGALCNILTHPRYQVTKTYWVMVKGALSSEAISRIQKGIWLAEGKTKPLRLKIIKKTQQHTTVQIMLREGMNREVRRIFARIGHPVKELKRIKIGSIRLGMLKPGQYRRLSKYEVQKIRGSIPH